MLKHVQWLLAGIIFWGSITAFLALLFGVEQEIILHKILIKYAILSLFSTIFVIYHSNGIPINKPKDYFVLPLLCVVLSIILWGWW